MKSRIVAAVTAGAIALSAAFSTPAAAWSEKEQNTLTTILAIIAAGAIVKEMGDDNKKPRHTPHREPARARIIPAECVYDVRTNRGPREVVSPSCMKEYGLARRLPDECAFEVRVKHKTRTVYGPRCLAQHGWRIGQYRY